MPSRCGRRLPGRVADGFRVVVRLSNDEVVDVDTFDGVPEAKTRALELVEQLGHGDDRWPFVHGRFLRPDAVVSVDIVEAAAT